LDEDFTFNVVYDVFPRFTIGAWKGIEVEVPEVSIADEDIERELEAIRDRNAVVQDRDDDALAAKGDVVTVNYSELGENGAVEAGTEREDFTFTIGSGYNIFKFDDDIVSMKKGETKDIEKTYPADFEDITLAGKTKKIRVSVINLKEKKLPDLDDDFAQDVDEKFKTLASLKADIRERLSKNLEQRLKELKVERVLGKIVENTPIDLPASMLRIQLDAQWRNFARQLNMSVENLRTTLGNSGEGLDKFEEIWKPEAVRALHSRLIAETLMRELNIEATEADFEKEFEMHAKGENISLEEVKEYYKNENIKSYLMEDIRERKLFDILLAENTVKTGEKKNYREFMEKKDNNE
jgi:trigger factor